MARIDNLKTLWKYIINLIQLENNDPKNKYAENIKTFLKYVVEP